MADVPTATSSVVLIADRCHIELGLAPWKRHRVGRTNPGLVSTYVRLAIGEEGYPVAANLDDFAFDKAGKTWVTTDFTSKVFIVDADGSGQLVVGGGSAAAFGRTWGDSQILYVVTGGAPVSMAPRQNRQKRLQSTLLTTK